MSTRPMEDISKSLVKTATVAASKTVTAFYPIKLTANGAENCGAGDSPTGYAQTGGTAGDIITYVPAGCGAIVKVKVGTGGATINGYLKVVSDGVADSGTLGGGTTLLQIAGKAMETGVAGDYIGVLPIVFAAVVAL